MTTNDGGPAFPQTMCEYNGAAFWPDNEGHGGLSARDYFAAAALTGLMANEPDTYDPLDVSLCAYSLADAMMAERAKREGGE